MSTETTTLAQAVEQVIARGTALRFDGLRLHFHDTVSVLNVEGRDGLTIGGDSLTRADVDAIREAFTAAGYVEADSWVATQGASWLSDGAKSVSFRLTRKEG